MIICKFNLTFVIFKNLNTLSNYIFSFINIFDTFHSLIILYNHENFNLHFANIVSYAFPKLYFWANELYNGQNYRFAFW